MLDGLYAESLVAGKPPSRQYCVAMFRRVVLGAVTNQDTSQTRRARAKGAGKEAERRRRAVAAP
jgi:hypothetical protein